MKLDRKKIVQNYAAAGLETRLIKDKPGKVYKPHSHARVLLFTLKGAAIITLGADTLVKAEPGKEIVIADNQEHSAVVGEEGWTYVFAASPEEMERQDL